VNKGGQQKFYAATDSGAKPKRLTQLRIEKTATLDSNATPTVHGDTRPPFAGRMYGKDGNLVSDIAKISISIMETSQRQISRRHLNKCRSSLDIFNSPG